MKLLFTALLLFFPISYNRSSATTSDEGLKDYGGIGNETEIFDNTNSDSDFEVEF